jgi:hypothetical protein
MDKGPELITFLEIDSKEVVNLIRGVEPICSLHYPYERHLTLGWFTDKNSETLCKFGKATLDCVKEQICKHAGTFLSETSFEIIVNHARRQPVSRGGGFYLAPMELCAQPLLKIHQGLTAFLESNHIFPSESISNYCPHVSLTIPMAQSVINQYQENLILQTLNDKIAKRQGKLPGKLILHSLAIRTILKYFDTQGIEQREAWDTRIVD